jgi:hypothetical protein
MRKRAKGQPGDTVFSLAVIGVHRRFQNQLDTLSPRAYETKHVFLRHRVTRVTNRPKKLPQVTRTLSSEVLFRVPLPNPISPLPFRLSPPRCSSGSASPLRHPRHLLVAQRLTTENQKNRLEIHALEALFWFTLVANLTNMPRKDTPPALPLFPSSLLVASLFAFSPFPPAASAAIHVPSLPCPTRNKKPETPRFARPPFVLLLSPPAPWRTADERRTVNRLSASLEIMEPNSYDIL